MVTSSCGSGSATADDSNPQQQQIAPPPATTASVFPNVVLRTTDGKAFRFVDDLVKNKIFLHRRRLPHGHGESFPRATALGQAAGPRYVYVLHFARSGKGHSESLRAYTAHFKLNPGWLFLTGENQNDSSDYAKRLATPILTRRWTRIKTRTPV